jgi:hypothetical protein
MRQGAVFLGLGMKGRHARELRRRIGRLGQIFVPLQADRHSDLGLGADAIRQIVRRRDGLNYA